jgi:hypothetical protein
VLEVSALTPIAVADGIPLARALADELVLASQMLCDLSYELGSDEATLRRHMASLQTIDHVTQIQLAIANLLRDGPAASVADVTLADMAQRLQQAAS